MNTHNYLTRIKDEHYSKEETDLIILAIGDRFKPIKDYRTR